MSPEEAMRLATDAFSQGLGDGYECGDNLEFGVGMTYTEYPMEINNVLNEAYDAGVCYGQELYFITKKEKTNV